MLDDIDFAQQEVRRREGETHLAFAKCVQINPATPDPFAWMDVGAGGGGAGGGAGGGGAAVIWGSNSAKYGNIAESPQASNSKGAQSNSKGTQSNSKGAKLALSAQKKGWSPDPLVLSEVYGAITSSSDSSAAPTATDPFAHVSTAAAPSPFGDRGSREMRGDGGF
jgi:hypothetical protein